MVVGGSGVDTIVRVDALHVPSADSYGVPPIEEWAGHTGTGVALGCATLGLTTGFLDFIGNDHQGTLIRERLAGTGVDFWPLISPHGTRRAVNLVGPDGRRTSFYDARDPLDLRMPAEHYLPRLHRARHVHLSITNFARYLYDDIEALGIPVSTDLHDWNGATPHHREFALRSDLVFLSTAGAGERIGAVMQEILRKGRAQAVIATAAAGGAYLLTPDDRTPRLIPPAVPPGPVLDSNGAGDAFTCGFLYGRLEGRDLEECARLGAIAGAHACTARGTHTALIKPDELSYALNSTGAAATIPVTLTTTVPAARTGDQVSRTGA
ncbi:carbohydrate kinase family protein [Streptomyces piniterrae]|uniref:Carbohydrate kinase family protein n=1 Tax=Streptomyces piniterrae TaxID=2571125 RepID=A0A4U0NTX4_9ACTN|nr:carbohydrate kinase family protein [Streptomyces piniterrae]